jgi:hypothetical protein
MKGNTEKQARGFNTADLAQHPVFGIWADREDLKHIHAWLKKIRRPRYLRDGGRLSSRPPQKSKRNPKS